MPKPDKKKLITLLSVNDDARRYFYHKADESLLEWLWDNGFLDIIKQKASDPKRILHRTPELDYLVRVSTKVPEQVVKIMLKVPISESDLNPEVVERFTWICGDLPSKELSQLASKIKNEQWPKLMHGFHSWGFEYGKMLKTLSEAKKYGSLLKISEAILAIKNPEEIDVNNYSLRNPFYFSDLGYTSVFTYLSGVDDKHTEEAFNLVCRTFGKMISVTSKESSDTLFKLSDSYYFIDVDFFKIKLEETPHSLRDNTHDLAALLTILAKRIIGNKSINSRAVRKIYQDNINLLPDNNSTWRLRLFVMSLRPDVFKQNIEQELFKLFEKKDNISLASNPEYYYALKAIYPYFSPEEKRHFQEAVIKHFGEVAEKPYKRYGWRILSTIAEDLTEDFKLAAEKTLELPLDPSYTPEPLVGPVFAGSVHERSPISEDELNKFSVEQIAQNLCGVWNPENIKKLDTKQDFFNPISAEGLADALKVNMKSRAQEYISHSFLFFDRTNLDQHYTYSFLRGIQEIIKDKKYSDDTDWSGLFILLNNILESGKATPFESDKRQRKSQMTWMANWGSVHTAIADVLQELLKGNDDTIINFSKYRNDLLGILDYLFHHPDPSSIDETKNSSDPFTEAINSVRGRAFEAFNHFVFHDGEGFPKEAKIKINNDVKLVFENLLKSENTWAIMFMFGHYLYFYYYRDEEWIMSLLDRIFPNESQKKDLYLAAWEGYLLNSVYKEIFPQFSSLYQKAVNFDSSWYTDRKYSKNLDELLATHLALAFMYFPEFDFDNTLFKNFWANKNINRKKEFIAAIGKHALSKDAEISKEIDLEKIKKFWDWALTTITDKNPFLGFGFWISPTRHVFEPKWLAEHIQRTLEKTNGEIEWEYGMMKSFPVLAKDAPQEIFAALKLYLKDVEKFGMQHHSSIYVDEEIFDTLKILYSHDSTKQEVYDLINQLLPLGSGRFWKLKEVLS